MYFSAFLLLYYPEESNPKPFFYCFIFFPNCMSYPVPLSSFDFYCNFFVYVCIFGFKGASTSKVIGARNEMMMDDYDGQMMFGELVGLKLPDIRVTGEEKPRKNLTQETCPDRGSNPGPLRDKRSCYHLFHSGGLISL